MDTTELDGFSKTIYDLLVAAYPQWIDYIDNDESAPTAFVLTIPSPQGGALALELFTYNEEITLAYDCFHTHLGWSDVPDEEAFAKAQEMIEDIINDLVLIVSYHKDGRVFQSKVIEIDELEHYRESEHDLTVVGWHKTYVSR